MLLLFGAAIGTAVLLFWFALTSDAPAAAARANLFANVEQPQAAESRLTGGTRRLGRAVHKVMPSSYLKGLDTTLVQAAHPWKLDLTRLLGIKAVLALSTVLLGAFAGRALFGIILGFMAFFLPDYLVMTRRDGRQADIQAAAADTIDQLTIVVEAGLGFDAAVQRVARTAEGPLAAELQRTVEDIRAGIPRDQALHAFAERTRLPEIRRLVTALVQAQRHGVTIAETLRIQSVEIRDKRTQRVEEKAAKLGTKLLFPIMFCFMPVFFVILLGPSIHGLLGSL